MRVGMLTEGTYPFFRGGVSTWIHNLISSIKEFRFTVVSVVASPGLKPVYTLPPNVENLMVIPLWGSEYAAEYAGAPIREFLRAKRRTNEKAVEEEFAPHLRTFLREVKVGGGDLQSLGKALLEMHEFLLSHNPEEAFRSKSIWEVFVDEVGRDPFYENLSVSTLIELAKVTSHVLRVLAFPIPEVDLFHSTAASLCGLIGVLSKLKYGTPYLVTEHGIYFRERMLDLISFTRELPGKIFWINFFRALVKLNYRAADKITPVCRFNVNWEREFGVPSWKVEVIYNGVDTTRFKPSSPVEATEKPIVLVMSRVEKLKDIANVIEAMRYVVRERPDVVCEIFGPIDDEEYYEFCLNLVKRWGLQGNVFFRGSTKTPEREYNRAAVVVQPSLTEGFPLTVVEAMSCGKLVIATDVGGVREALNGCGILVPPRSPEKLSRAILKGLSDEALRRELGRRARERVCRLFSYERFIEDYKRVYIELLSETKLRGVHEGRTA